jgi:hypothetical protein
MEWPIYLRNKSGFIHRVDITGETTRSWVCSRYGRDTKYAKKDHQIATEDEYRKDIWRDKHQYRIGHLVGNRLPYETLKKIADLIGYDETKESK